MSNNYDSMIKRGLFYDIKDYQKRRHKAAKRPSVLAHEQIAFPEIWRSLQVSQLSIPQ